MGTMLHERHIILQTKNNKERETRRDAPQDSTTNVHHTPYAHTHIYIYLHTHIHTEWDELFSWENRSQKKGFCYVARNFLPMETGEG